MDLTENYLLAYGGFNENEIKESKKDNFNDLHKIIKINDYKSQNVIKTNMNECSICLEEFEIKETTCSEIKKSLEIYQFKKYLSDMGQDYLDKFIDLENNKNENSNNIIIISCYHIFHKKCLIEWYKKNNSCPLCRIELKKIK